jgi:hypothetical protein
VHQVQLQPSQAVVSAITVVRQFVRIDSRPCCFQHHSICIKQAGTAAGKSITKNYMLNKKQNKRSKLKKMRRYRSSKHNNVVQIISSMYAIEYEQMFPIIILRNVQKLGSIGSGLGPSCGALLICKSVNKSLWRTYNTWKSSRGSTSSANTSIGQE